ncbi:MAG TPA: RnfH family protein [Noviherbaspirillum sp.]
MADIHVQVCYAKPGRQWLQDLTVQEGTTLEAAIMLSGIVNEVSEIDLSVCRTGIYGKLKTLDTVLREHDRVEIYRPLIADPKESRRKRAVKKGDKKAL